MKKNVLAVLLTGALLGSAFLSAQGKIAPGAIDVGNKSPIRFNMDKTTQAERDAINKEHLDFLMKRDPDYITKRNNYEKMIQQYLAKYPNGRANDRTMASVITVPVVIHIVWNSANPPGNISDAQAQSQITVLNQDYGRTNSDTGSTPAVWKSVAANMGVQFCLAQRDPAGNPSTGIERRQNNAVTSWSTNDAVKYTAQGGLDIWDPTRYLNIWVCDLGQSLLGYGEFPTGSTTATYGVVILNSGFGNTGTVSAPYQLGRTTTHEFSHCFNLYHIWGDDNGACTGTDYCADTPNQANSTNNCPAFPSIDACANSPAPNAGDPVHGIMFMDYMDYSYDNCMNMFTQMQSARTNAVLTTAPYQSLATSNGCTPVNLLNDDAGISGITSPAGTVCNPSFTPVVVLKDFGGNALTSCNIVYTVDGGAPVSLPWTGSLASQATASVTLAAGTTTLGAHSFKAWTAMPNGVADAQPSNDTLKGTFQVVGTGSTLPFFEGFEGSVFVPANWTLNNSDASNTWARSTKAAKTGTASAWMDNFTYASGAGQIDEMVLPGLNLTTVAAPMITFQVAYTYYNQTTPSAQIFGDTLTVLLSTDCGATWNTLFYKGGQALATKTPVNDATTSFVPTASQWMRYSLSLSPYASANNAIIKFRNTSNYADDMWIDDINVGDFAGIQESSLLSSMNLYPNPTSGQFSLQLDMPVAGNFNVRVYDMLGRTLETISEQNSLGGVYNLDLSANPNGMYFVELITNQGTATRKVLLDKR